MFSSGGGSISLQAVQAHRLIAGDAHILHSIRRQSPVIPADGTEFAVPLNVAMPAQRESASKSFFRTAGNDSGKQVQIGLIRTQHTDRDAQPFQPGERSLIDECPMLRHLAGGPFIEHHLTVDRFIQRFPVLQRQQDRSKYPAQKASNSAMSQENVSSSPRWQAVTSRSPAGMVQLPAAPLPQVKH